MLGEIYYRVSVAPTPEESLGRLLVVVFGFGMALGLLLNVAFALWVSLRILRIERWMTDRVKQ